jgi:hypothetical protein
MTPFRNDESNPFHRKSVWPGMPAAPMRLDGLRKAAPPQPSPAFEVVETPVPVPPAEPPVYEPPVYEPPVYAPPVYERAAPEIIASEPQPLVAPIGLERKRQPRRDPRLTPLVAAAAVGAGGMAPRRRPPRPRRRPPAWRWAS